MAKISFGTIDAVMQQTPMIIRRVKLALNFFIGGMLIYIPDIAQEFNTTERKVTVILGVTLVAVNSIGVLFGVEPDENKNTSVNN